MGEKKKKTTNIKLADSKCSSMYMECSEIFALLAVAYHFILLYLMGNVVLWAF